MAKRILLLDNYDSFTYNLYDYLCQLGVEVEVHLNDKITAESGAFYHVDGVVLSPGPGRPQQAGNMMAILDSIYDKLPILGICLGHQAIGEYFGARLDLARRPMHGYCSPIEHDGTKLFKKIPNPMQAMRYHSLLLTGLPEQLEATAVVKGSGEIMGIRHKHLPIQGVQFHPEAHLTPQGILLIANWLESL
jgi:anthranilate synthase/aminodeoxychorismate synthase-like glutamine amidotransferase